MHAQIQNWTRVLAIVKKQKSIYEEIMYKMLEDEIDAMEMRYLRKIGNMKL